jgi:tetratricopeptide (TPR) repeat protein
MERALAHREQPARRTRRGWWLGLAAVGLGAAAFAAWQLTRGPLLPAGISAEEYAEAARRYADLYGHEPSRMDVLSVLGEMAIGAERMTEAVACFREIPSADPMYGPSARLQEGQALATLRHADAAERSLREFLRLTARDPDVPVAHLVGAYKWLTYLLSVQLRFEDRRDVLDEMHARGLADVYDSKQRFFPHLLIWHSTTGREPLGEFLRNDPDDPRLRVALARYRVYEGELAEAQELLESFHRERPHDLDGTAALLECYFEQDDWTRFGRVAGSLPAYQAGEPWLLTRMRAQWALHEQQWEAAIAHFQQVIDNDPSNPWCHMGLAEAWGELGRERERQEALARSRIIAGVRVNLYNVTGTDAQASIDVARACEEIGFESAAAVFRQHARRIERSMARPAAGQTP